MALPRISGTCLLLALLAISCTSTDKKNEGSEIQAFYRQYAVPVPNPATAVPKAITSDLNLYEYLQADIPVMKKLSSGAKDELLESVSLQFRGFDSTGALFTTLSKEDLDAFLNWSATIPSVRVFASDLQNPDHPLSGIFSRITPSDKACMIRSAHFEFRGFASEKLLREELNPSEYKTFYDLVTGTDTEIVGRE
jgi:hypothetical protein